MTKIGSTLLALLVAGSPAFACSVSSVCSDTSASFYGEVILDGFRLSWSTTKETSEVAKYRLRRCTGGTCKTVADVYPSGGCEMTAAYAYTDRATGAPTYWIEVWKVGSGVECTYSVTP